VVREGNFAGVNRRDPGEAFRQHGTFEPSDLGPLAAFVEWSRLLGLKVAKPQEMEGTLSVSVVRGAKRREIVIPDSDSASAPAAWAALKLVRGITSEVDWKNEAGLSVSTGVHVTFETPGDGQSSDPDFHGFPRFSVRNQAGKEVAVALVESESLGIRQPLPPGSYTIAPQSPADAKADARGRVWRASQSKFSIEPGSFTSITIALDKVPPTP